MHHAIGKRILVLLSSPKYNSLPPHDPIVYHDYIHKDLSFFNNNFQRETHKFYGPSTSHVIAAAT